MVNVSLVFVILHYTAMKDTVECVSSIEDKTNDPYRIVIVDNASPDGSGQKLADLYKDDEKVHVVLSKKNEGFARGNNLGINYALENYQFKYCVVMNNDTLVIENDLLKKLDCEYARQKFSVLGPMIFTADGYADSNPVRTAAVDKNYIVSSIKSEKRHLKAESNAFLRSIRNVWFWLKPLVKPEMHARKDYLNKQYDVMLHGSVLIFNKDFFEVFSGFYPKTFLFHEEEILHLLVMRKGLHTVYEPAIHIYHKEDASTNNIYRSAHEKRLAKFTYSVESLEILQQLFDEDCSV